MIECSAVHAPKSLRANDVSSTHREKASGAKGLAEHVLCLPCSAKLGGCVRRVQRAASGLGRGLLAGQLCLRLREERLRLPRQRHGQGGLPDTENDSFLIENACALPISATVKVSILQQPYGCFSHVVVMASYVSSISDTAAKVSIGCMQSRRQTCSRRSQPRRRQAHMAFERHR